MKRFDFLYGTHLMRAEVAGTAAPGAGGKSTMSIAEGLAIASGKPLLGARVPYPMRPLLINLEDRRDVINKRVAAAMRHYGLTPADIGGRLFIMAKGDLKARVGPKVSPVATAAFVNALTQFIKDEKIDVVSIDPFIRTHMEAENDTTAMQRVVEVFEDIAFTCDCAISLWHHNRKSNGGDVTVDSARGASSFVDACRSVRMLERMSAQEAKNMGVKNRNPIFKSFSGKLNYAPMAEICDWFKIENVPLLNGEGPARIGDYIGVVTKWRIPTTSELTTEQLKEICAVLANGEGRDSTTATMWAGNLIAPVLGLDQEDDKEKLKQTIKKLIKTGVLERVNRPDAKSMPRPYIVPRGWFPPQRDTEEVTVPKPKRSK